MRRARPAAALLGAAVALLVTAAPAPALLVETVPPTEGLQFTFAGIELQSDAAGMVDVPALDLPSVRAGLRMRTTTVGTGVRARFAGWRHGRVSVRREYLVRLAFRDPAGRPVDAGRITAVTLRQPDGARRVLEPVGAHWLPGNRLVTLGRTTVSRPVTWAIERVTADGVNVVASSQQRLAPARGRVARVEVRFHTMRFAARDALLGSAIGSDIRLRHPDGRVTRHRLAGGETVLHGLPAGSYEIRVTAPSMGAAWPVALSRDQDVEVSVISYADIGLVGGALALVAIGLVLAGRPRLRARLRRAAA